MRAGRGQGGGRRARGALLQVAAASWSRRRNERLRAGRGGRSPAGVKLCPGSVRASRGRGAALRGAPVGPGVPRGQGPSPLRGGAAFRGVLRRAQASALLRSPPALLRSPPALFHGRPGVRQRRPSWGACRARGSPAEAAAPLLRGGQPLKHSEDSVKVKLWSAARGIC